MIKINNLFFEYSKNDFSLNIPTLTIKKGEKVALIGDNGAGKTTLLMSLLDFVDFKGEIQLAEKKIKNTHQWKKSVGAYIDESFLIDFLRPDEYFNFLATGYEITKNDLEKKKKVFAKFFSNKLLNSKQLIRKLSKGQKQIIGLLGSLVNNNAELLILDEPFINLDPSSIILPNFRTAS